MLKVQLTAAWYHVVQGEKLKGLAALLRRTRPDLVLTAQTLPDGTAADVKRLIAAQRDLADVPVVAIAPQNDKQARLQALTDGLDDVLVHPFKDTLLLARVRSLLRAHADTQDLHVKDGPQSIGFAEDAAGLITSSRSEHVCILTQSVRTGSLWRNALANHSQHDVSSYTQSHLHGVLSGPTPEAIIVELGANTSGMTILADLKSRSATRHTVLIGVLHDNSASRASEALDRGADAVCLGGFCAQEIVLRLNNQIARKTRIDRLRASLKQGLADSWVDPLTGLHNRRYATYALEKIAERAVRTGRGFAVMLAGLDHFKAVNDRFGHSIGDLVLKQTASRMREALGDTGFVARLGGEEFLIAVPDISRDKAMKLAETICDSVCGTPVVLPDEREVVTVTVSIGLKACAPMYEAQQTITEPIEDLIKSADTALYAAKRAGRNQVSIRQSAA